MRTLPPPPPPRVVHPLLTISARVVRAAALALCSLSLKCHANKTRCASLDAVPVLLELGVAWGVSEESENTHGMNEYNNKFYNQTNGKKKHIYILYTLINKKKRAGGGGQSYRKSFRTNMYYITVTFYETVNCPRPLNKTHYCTILYCTAVQK